MAENHRPIDHPRALGEELQRLRQAAGVSLDEIVAETKVSRQFFEAIEAGRYQYLPEKVFCKNFLRQYVDIVGCDSRGIEVAFERAWDRFQENSGSFATLKVEDPPKPHARWWVWLPFLLVALVVVLLVVITIRSGNGPEQLPPDPRRSAVERPTPLRARSTPSPVTASPEVVEDEVGETEIDVIAELRVAVGKECWVHYRDRDGQVGEALLGGGEVTTLELPGPVLLTIGNADAVTIRVSGIDYSDLGKPGEVARFLLGAGGLTSFAGDPRDG